MPRLLLSMPRDDAILGAPRLCQMTHAEALAPRMMQCLARRDMSNDSRREILNIEIWQLSLYGNCAANTKIETTDWKFRGDNTYTRNYVTNRYIIPHLALIVPINQSSSLGRMR